MRSVFLRVLFLVFGLTAGILLTEGSLRLLNEIPAIRARLDKQKAIASDPLTYSSTLKYTVKPYTTTNCSALPGKANKAVCHENKYGLRDDEENFNKPANTYRIIALGDSMTYGLGVNSDQSYPKVLEKLLNTNNKSDLRYQVINMGMTFYGPPQFYYLYEELGKKYHPDFIVVGFYDLVSPWQSAYYTTNKKYLFYKALPDTLVPFQLNQFLKTHSYFYRLLLSGYYHIVDKQEIQLEKVYFQGRMDRYQYETQLTTSSPLMKLAWGESEYYMDLLIKDATAHKIPVLVLGLPSRAQIIPDEWQTIKARGLLSDQRLYTDSASRKQLLLLCQKHNWTCLDLQDDLRKTDDPKKVFLGSDIHFSPLGNKIAGEAIYNFLTQQSKLGWEKVNPLMKQPNIDAIASTIFFSQ